MLFPIDERSNQTAEDQTAVHEEMLPRRGRVEMTLELDDRSSVQRQRQRPCGRHQYRILRRGCQGDLSRL